MSMGRRGRYGKYGEIKRLERLRQAGVHDPSHRAAKVHTADGFLFSRKQVTQSGRIRIVAARAADIDFIERLSGSAFRKYGSYRQVIAQWFQSAVTETIIAHLDGRPVGFAMLGIMQDAPSSQQVCELLAIAVKPTKQRKGVGQKLLKAAEKKASGWQAERLFLHTARDNIAARGLFTKNGYIPSGIKTQFYPEGQDALVMSKTVHSHLSPEHLSAKALRLRGKKSNPSNF